MKPLIYVVAGTAVVLALVAGPAAAQGQQGGGASAGASAGARTGGGGDGGASRAGSSGPSGGSISAPSGSSGGGSYAGPPSGWSGPNSSNSSGSSGSPGVSGRPGSAYSGGSARVNPANGNSSYVREIYGSPSDRAVPRGSRPNPGGPTVGQAVLRPNGPHRPPDSGSGWYPYYPYYGWVYGLGYYGMYDPWWYWGSPYGYDSGYYGYYGNDQGGRGGLKLKVEPTFAEVFVDGYYMGIVNDFDGTFQRLELEVGAHHIEIRAPGYQTIVFDVRIEFNDTVTYRGELQPLSKK